MQSSNPVPVDHSFPTPENDFTKAAFEGNLSAVKSTLSAYPFLLCFLFHKRFSLLCLLSSRSNPSILNQTNTRKQTALYCAASNGPILPFCFSSHVISRSFPFLIQTGHLDVVKLLLSQSGIKINHSENGSTPLHGSLLFCFSLL